MTPEEAWSDRKPVVDHFRIFGCIAYAHVPDEKRKKLDDKAEKCIFLGISEVSKAYKLFNPMTKRIVISRDVVFDEEHTWQWTENGAGQQPIPTTFDEIDNKDDQQMQLPNADQQPEVFGESSMAIEPDESVQPRQRKTPAWMTDYVSGDDLSDDDVTAHFALFADCDPLTFQEAVQDSKWQNAMDEEMRSIEKNNTWELVELPEDQKSIGVKWIYKTKLNKDGNIDKYKGRLVVKGYKQEYGVDYKEVFAPVVRLDTVRLVLSMAAQNSWSIY